MNQALHTIFTHSGAFHADEGMAIALLKRFYLTREIRVAVDLTDEQVENLVVHGKRPSFDPIIGPDGLADAREPCWVIRTRSAALLEKAQRHPEIFVLDVGGKYEKNLLNLDHHQASMTDTWEDGTPYSSTGLAWRWLQENGHLSSLDAGIQAEMEATLIRPLDAHDNGVALCDEGNIVEAFNRSSGDNADQARQFAKSVDFLSEVLENNIYLCSLKLQSKQVLEKAWEKAKDNNENFVILEESLAYSDGTGLLKEVSNDQAQMAGWPGKGNRYTVISLSGNEGRFSSKCPVPEAWRGQMDFEVVIENQKIPMIFAHKTGFMCIVKGGPKEARMVAKAVIAHNAALENGNGNIKKRKGPSP